MNTPRLNGKLLPIVLTVLLAGAAALAASQYSQGNVEARVAANEQDIANFDGILRSIDRRLARIEGRLPVQPTSEFEP